MGLKRQNRIKKTELKVNIKLKEAIKKIMQTLKSETILGDILFAIRKGEYSYHGAVPVIEKIQKEIGASALQMKQIFDYLVDQKLIEVEFIEKETYYYWKQASVLKIHLLKCFVYKTNVYTYLSSFDSDEIFIAREFDNPETMQIYEGAIKPAILALKLQPIMLEDSEHIKAGNLDKYIKDSIKNCLALVCDITPKLAPGVSDVDALQWNPNVFFEIGLADGYGKKIIFIADQRISKLKGGLKLPFDISKHNVFFYDEKDTKSLENYLKRQLELILSPKENPTQL